MIEAALRTKLLSYSPLTAVVGQRIYIRNIPANPTFPLVTYFKLPSQRHNDIDVAMANVQIDGWTTQYTQAQSVQENVRKAIQREKGIWSGVAVLSVVQTLEFIDYEEDTKIWHSIAEYRIKYRAE